MTTNREQDVLDAIDALVDEQMAGGEPRGGYDYGDPDYPSCPHCSRGWHGLAITQRIERMRWTGEMDEDYRYAEDDSPVLCPGSEFIGPVATPDQLHWMRLDDDTKRRFPHGYIPSVNEMILAAMQMRNLYGDIWDHIPYSLPELDFPNEGQPTRPYLLPSHARRLIQGVLRRNIMRSRPWCEWSINDGDRGGIVEAHSETIRGYRLNYAIYDEVVVDPVRSAQNRLDEFRDQLAVLLVDDGVQFTPRLWLPGDQVESLEAPPETPQHRALPRPSTTPPMWANDPARTRRTRNRSRNIRTPRI